MEQIELAIIGSGPAGYTASIYAARANIKVVLFQGIQPGGQLTITTDVENYPGFPNGILGPQLMNNFEQQSRNCGADIRCNTVTDVDVTSNPFVLTLDDFEKISTKAVIIATGASAKWLGIDGEQKFYGNGVSACAVCDGFFFKGKEVAIVGAGDTACEEALYLSKLCSKVNMIIRKDYMRASKIMQQRIFKTTNIEIHWNAQTKEILGNEKVESIKLYKDNKEFILPVSAIFIAIGHKPNSDIFKGKIDMDEQGYIKVITGGYSTNVTGIFAAGDVQDKTYRQAITAAGSGCAAALDVERFLSSL